MSCEDCNNASDPITLEDFTEVPSQFIFKVRDAVGTVGADDNKSSGVTHCFDIRALYEYYDKCGKLENPLNRTAFSESTLNEFLSRVIELGLSKETTPQAVLRQRDDEEESPHFEEIVTIHRWRGGHSERHHHHSSQRRRPGRRNVTVSSSLMQALGGSRVELPPPIRPSPRSPLIERPARKVEVLPPPINRPPQRLEQGGPRAGLEPPRIMQHDSILAASRPGASSGGGGGASFSIPAGPLAPAGRDTSIYTGRVYRPILQEYYEEPKIEQFIPHVPQVPHAPQQFMPRQHFMPAQPEIVPQQQQPQVMPLPQAPQQPRFDLQPLVLPIRPAQVVTISTREDSDRPRTGNGNLWLIIGLLLSVGIFFWAWFTV
jgi:hypothetical protein